LLVRFNLLPNFS
jgi:hypothetical protein